MSNYRNYLNQLAATPGRGREELELEAFLTWDVGFEETCDLTRDEIIEKLVGLDEAEAKAGVIL